MTDAESQPVDEPVETGADAEPDERVSTDEDGIQDFDDEDSEEVEATLGDDSFSQAVADADGESEH